MLEMPDEIRFFTQFTHKLGIKVDGRLLGKQDLPSLWRVARDLQWSKVQKNRSIKKPKIPYLVLTARYDKEGRIKRTINECADIFKVHPTTYRNWETLVFMMMRSKIRVVTPPGIARHGRRSVSGEMYYSGWSN